MAERESKPEFLDRTCCQRLMGERLEPLDGIYRGKTHSQGFIHITEPPIQDVDERRAQGFNGN